MSDNSYQKYLKYKNKYLRLKQQLEGGNTPSPFINKTAEDLLHYNHAIFEGKEEKSLADNFNNNYFTHHEFYKKAFTHLFYPNFGISVCSSVPGVQKRKIEFDNMPIYKKDDKGVVTPNFPENTKLQASQMFWYKEFKRENIPNPTFGLISYNAKTYDKKNLYISCNSKETGGIHMPKLPHISMPSMPSVSSTDVANAISTLATGTR